MTTRIVLFPVVENSETIYRLFFRDTIRSTAFLYIIFRAKHSSDFFKEKNYSDKHTFMWNMKKSHADDYFAWFHFDSGYDLF